MILDSFGLDGIGLAIRRRLYHEGDIFGHGISLRNTTPLSKNGKVILFLR